MKTNIRKFNKNQNFFLSALDKEDLIFSKLAVRHPVIIEVVYKKNANEWTYINNEEGC